MVAPAECGDFGALCEPLSLFFSILGLCVSHYLYSFCILGLCVSHYLSLYSLSPTWLQVVSKS